MSNWRKTHKQLGRQAVSALQEAREEDMIWV